jgi:phosphate transport system substrate-binding protein
MDRPVNCLAGLVAAVLTTALAQAGTITAKGSDTLVILAQKWAQAYMTGHPGTTIQVTGGGSGTGFAALQNQTTDLANASRPIRARETEACIKAFNKRPTEYKVCLDGLSVYVHARNPVTQLTLQQLEGIFTGRLRNWRQLGGEDAPITVYSRENSSGTYEFFKERVLKGKDYLASAQTMPGTAAVVQAVGKDAHGIGYGGAAYGVGAADGAGARRVAIRKDPASPAIVPSEASVGDGTYPMWRYLYIYVNPALDKGEVAAYLAWIRGEEGQRIVKEAGYYPLPPGDRK